MILAHIQKPAPSVRQIRPELHLPEALDHLVSSILEKRPETRPQTMLEVAEALLPYLECVLSGPEAWREEPTIARAIEIRDGTVRNEKILSFQNREDDYPHPIRSS